MTRILVTGANGFVGQALCLTLSKEGYVVRGAVRTEGKKNLLSSVAEPIIIGDIGPYTDWQDALRNVEVVFHLAARVHVLKETSPDPLAAFRSVNTAGSKRLARLAAHLGVRRLIYLSSIKVNGEKTDVTPFTETDKPYPHDPYALSKWEAEIELQQIARETELEVTIVRPSLIYGPNVKGNFLRLIQLTESGIPLPLASVKNHRSMIYVENLTNLLLHCVQHPGAANETFLASDGKDLSTAELIRCLAAALGRPARLLPFPELPLRLVGRLLGKEEILNRLFDSLMANTQKARQVLGWSPPFSWETGISQTASWYLAQREKNNFINITKIFLTL